MRTLAQIAKEDKKIAKMYFNKPIIKVEVYVPYYVGGPRKKLGKIHKKHGKMIGEA